MVPFPFQCPYLRFDGKKLSQNIFKTNMKFRIGTNYMEYDPQHNEDNVICNIDEQFGQFGVYNATVETNVCKIVTLKEPKNIYFRKFRPRTQ